MKHTQIEKEVTRYHYTDCGLDNVWLLGGVEEHETPFGTAISIRGVDALHEAIGRSIAKSKIMTGDEFRFLRLELDLSQSTLANLIGATEQQVYRYETGKSKVPGPVRTALSGYYLETIDPNSRMSELMKELAELDASLGKLRYFEAKGSTWTEAA